MLTFRLSGVPFEALKVNFRFGWNNFICWIILRELEYSRICKGSLKNDIFYNPKTTDIKFLISRKFEVTILLRKSEGIKGLLNLPKRSFGYNWEHKAYADYFALMMIKEIENVKSLNFNRFLPDIKFHVLLISAKCIYISVWIYKNDAIELPLPSALSGWRYKN